MRLVQGLLVHQSHLCSPTSASVPVQTRRFAIFKAMSLKDLWAAHSAGCAVNDTCTALAHTAAAMNSPVAAAQTKKRVREELVKTSPSQTRSRSIARKLPAGETDLGLGSILIVKPGVFPQHRQLFKTLQVAAATCAYLSSAYNAENNTCRHVLLSSQCVALLCEQFYLINAGGGAMA